LTVAGTVAGSAAAVVAYQTTAAVPTSATSPAADTTTPAPVVTTTWLPCERGWKVKGDTCVRVKQKVVVVRDLPAPAAAPAQSVAPQAAPVVASSDNHAAQPRTRTRHAEDDHAGEDSRDEADHASEDAPEHEDVGGDD
jgi:hypothetical protein